MHHGNHSGPNVTIWVMSCMPLPVSVTFRGMTHRGCYHLSSGGELVVEAFGLGSKVVDAGILQGELGEPARKMAKLLLMEQVKESSTDVGLWSARESAGATARISYQQ